MGGVASDDAAQQECWEEIQASQLHAALRLELTDDVVRFGQEDRTASQALMQRLGRTVATTQTQRMQSLLLQDATPRTAPTAGVKTLRLALVSEDDPVPSAPEGPGRRFPPEEAPGKPVPPSGAHCYLHVLGGPPCTYWVHLPKACPRPEWMPTVLDALNLFLGSHSQSLGRRVPLPHVPPPAERMWELRETEVHATWARFALLPAVFVLSHKVYDDALLDSCEGCVSLLPGLDVCLSRRAPPVLLSDHAERLYTLREVLEAVLGLCLKPPSDGES